MVYPNVVLVDANISTFNGVLTFLSQQPLFSAMQYVLNEVIPRHNISFNMDTYRILLPFRRNHDGFLSEIKQNPGHNDVLTVLRRMEQIDIVHDGEVSRAYRVIYGDVIGPFPPGPIVEMSPRRWKFLKDEWMTVMLQAISWSRSANSQQELVQSMDSVLERNAKLRLSSTSSNWVGFFYRFYDLTMQFGDFFFRQLLEKMQGDGSNVQPDPETFSAILLGLANNVGLQQGNKKSVIDTVLDHIMPKHRVHVEDLQSYTKLAVFWGIGRKIPLNNQDRITFQGSYETLPDRTTAQGRHEIYRHLRLTA